MPECSGGGAWDGEYPRDKVVSSVTPLIVVFLSSFQAYKLGESGNAEIRFRWQVS
jgi:hypothetical protein